MQTVRDVKKRENERRYRTDRLRQIEDDILPPRPPLPGNCSVDQDIYIRGTSSINYLVYMNKSS